MHQRYIIFALFYLIWLLTKQKILKDGIVHDGTMILCVEVFAFLTRHFPFRTILEI